MDKEQELRRCRSEIALDTRTHGGQRQECLITEGQSKPTKMLSNWTEALMRGQQELLQDSEPVNSPLERILIDRSSFLLTHDDI